MNKITERVVRNWITTMIGLALAIVSIVMWYTGKIEASQMLIVAPIVFAFIFVKHSFFIRK